MPHLPYLAHHRPCAIGPIIESTLIGQWRPQASCPCNFPKKEPETSPEKARSKRKRLPPKSAKVPSPCFLFVYGGRAAGQSNLSRLIVSSRAHSSHFGRKRVVIVLSEGFRVSSVRGNRLRQPRVINSYRHEPHQQADDMRLGRTPGFFLVLLAWMLFMVGSVAAASSARAIHSSSELGAREGMMGGVEKEYPSTPALASRLRARSRIERKLNQRPQQQQEGDSDVTTTTTTTTTTNTRTGVLNARSQGSLGQAPWIGMGLGLTCTALTAVMLG